MTSTKNFNVFTHQNSGAAPNATQIGLHTVHGSLSEMFVHHLLHKGMQWSRQLR